MTFCMTTQWQHVNDVSRTEWYPDDVWQTDRGHLWDHHQVIDDNDDYKDDIDDGREYEGPFGEWHEEHLCKPKEFLKQGQQNYQSYQGMFAGNFTFK